MCSIRIIYTKTKEAVYLPNFVVRDAFYRAFVMSDIVVVKDKNNNPEISIFNVEEGYIESIYEVMDVKLLEEVDIAFTIKLLNESLPVGIVVLSIEYITLEKNSHADQVLDNVTFEITPEYNFKGDATNREISDKRRKYRENMEEYLSQNTIDIILKSDTRSERIDIKPYILSYKMQISDTLQVKIKLTNELYCSPKYIVEGFNKCYFEDYNYTIRKIKIELKDGEKI